MHPDLTFEQVPPLRAPLRFFLTAPAFGVAAGLYIAIVGEDAFGSRWTPASLATTHLFALGFMLQAMCGALFQFLPVGVGQSIWQPSAVAAVVHLLLTFGTILLAAGFAIGQPVLLLAAAAFLMSGIGIFALAAGVALWRARAGIAATPLLRLALASLLIAAILGSLLATGIALPLPLPFPALTDVHLAWALGGWGLTLLIGVSSFVVPMFQLTPPYPRRLSRIAAPAMLALLLLWSLGLAGVAPVWTNVAALGLMLLTAGFAATTLWLQRRGRRRVGDATFGFFRAGMACLLAFAASVAASLAFPALADDPRFALWLGVLALPGAFSCVIQGMLYKIVPFLAWMHLQRTGAPITELPNMRAFVSETAARNHLRLHLLALVVAATAAVAMPPLTALAGLLLTTSYGWLGTNLVIAIRRYRAFRDRIAAMPARGW